MQPVTPITSIPKKAKKVPKRGQNFIFQKMISSNEKTGIHVGIVCQTSDDKDKDGQYFVLKFAYVLPETESSSNAIASLKKEYNLMNQLKHPNIVEVFDCRSGFFDIETDGHVAKEELFYLQMELAEIGDLIDLFSIVEPWCGKYCQFFFRQIAKAVKYMHDNKHAHRDLKPDNMVVDGHLNVKITDLEFAMNYSSGTLFYGRVGTPKYMAPEIQSNYVFYDPMKADVYALGLTLFAMFFLRLPLDSELENSKDMDKNLIFSKNSRNWEVIKQNRPLSDPLPESLIELIIAMLKYDFNKRCTLEYVLASPWLNQPIDDNVVKNEIYKKILNSKKPVVLPKVSDGFTSTCYGEAITSSRFLHAKLKFTDRSQGPERPTILGNRVIYCKNIQFLSELILTKATHMEFTYEFDEENQLVLTNKDGIKIKILIEKLPPGPTKGFIAGRLYGKYEVSFVRLEGDIFEFYRLKNELGSSITGACDEILEEGELLWTNIH